MSQAQSKTTVAGCTLEDLCRGVKNYVCDASCLVGLEGIDVIAAKDELLSQLSKIFDEIELQTDCKVKKFYIGKAIVKKRKSRGRQRTYEPFNPMDPCTWKKSGISSRWCAHRDKEYGKDGLVVLGAVTRDSVPNVCHGKVSQEQYAIALQQMILHHLMLIAGDDRLQNDTFLVSKADGGKSIAYAIYVAFTLEQQTLSENGDFLRYSSPSSSEASPLHKQYNDDSIVDLRAHSDNDDIQSDDDSLPPFPPISISPLRQYEVSTKGNLVNTMEVNSIASPLSSNNQTTNLLTPSDTEARIEEDILLGLYDHSVVSPTQLFNKQVVHKKNNSTSEVTANNESTFMFLDQNALQSNASLVNSSQQAKHSIILPTLQLNGSETNKRQPNMSTCKHINSTPSTAVQETCMSISQPMAVDLSLQNQLESRKSRQMSRKRPSISTFESTNAKYTGPKVSQKTYLPQVSQQTPPDTSKAITSLTSHEPQPNYTSFAPLPKLKKIDGSQPIYDPKNGNYILSAGVERNPMESTMLKNTNLPSGSSSTLSSCTLPEEQKSSVVKAQPTTTTITAVHPSLLNEVQSANVVLIPIVLNSENKKRRAYTTVALDTNSSLSTVSQKEDLPQLCQQELPDSSKIITSSSLHVVVPTCPSFTIPSNFKTIERSQGTYNQETSKPTDAMERNNMSSTTLKKTDLPSVLNRKANSDIPPPKKVKTSQVKAQSHTVTTKAMHPRNKRLETFQNTLKGHPTTSTLSQSTNSSKMLPSSSQISSSKPKVHALPPNVIKPNLIVPVTTVNTSSIISDKCRQSPKKRKKVTFHEPIVSMKQPKVSTVSRTSVQDHLPHKTVITNNSIETVNTSASLPLKSAAFPMKVPKNKEKQKPANSSKSCSYVSVIQSQPKDFTKK